MTSPFSPRFASTRAIAFSMGLISTALFSSACEAQTITSGTPIVSGGNIVTSSAPSLCPKCGRIHGTTAAPSSVATVSATSPVGRSSGLRSGGSVGNVLSALNAQRSRQGLSSLRYDPALQAVAQRRAQMMASTGNKNHPPGSFAPGTYEGVGWSSSYSPSGVSACFTSDPNMRVAGAAMATGRDGVYFCVVYR